MTKRTISLIAKGVLLWVTALNTILFISAADSPNYLGFLVWFIVTVSLILSCTHSINKDEFMTISGNKFLSKHYPELLEEDE